MVAAAAFRTSTYVERKYQRYGSVFWGPSISVCHDDRKQTCTVRNESLGGLSVLAAPVCGLAVGEVVTIQSGMLRRQVRVVYVRTGDRAALHVGLAFMPNGDYL